MKLDANTFYPLELLLKKHQKEFDLWKNVTNVDNMSSQELINFSNNLLDNDCIYISPTTTEEITNLIDNLFWNCYIMHDSPNTIFKMLEYQQEVNTEFAKYIRQAYYSSIEFHYIIYRAYTNYCRDYNKKPLFDFMLDDKKKDPLWLWKNEEDTTLLAYPTSSDKNDVSIPKLKKNNSSEIIDEFYRFDKYKDKYTKEQLTKLFEFLKKDTGVNGNYKGSYIAPETELSDFLYIFGIDESNNNEERNHKKSFGLENTTRV